MNERILQLACGEDIALEAILSSRDGRPSAENQFRIFNNVFTVERNIIYTVLQVSRLPKADIDICRATGGLAEIFH